MKKIISVLIAAIMLLGMVACGGDKEPAEEITFKNKLDVAIVALHINSSTEENDWGDALNYSKIGKGASLKIKFEKFAGTGSVYDVGVLDEDGMNYDIYGVSLAIGDTLELSLDGDIPKLTVTGADGAVKTYDGEPIYTNSDNN